jgi:hypothetical protein
LDENKEIVDLREYPHKPLIVDQTPEADENDQTLDALEKSVFIINDEDSTIEF